MKRIFITLCILCTLGIMAAENVAQDLDPEDQNDMALLDTDDDQESEG